MVLVQDGPYSEALLSNVRTLLRSRDVSLALKCRLLDSMKPLEQLADDASWPPFIASWQLYRSIAVRTLASMPLDSKRDGSLDLLCLLLRWASKFGFDLVDVPDEAANRQALLQAHLVLCTVHLSRQERWSEVVTLWSHQFSSLMPAPGQEVAILAHPACKRLKSPYSEHRIPFDAQVRIAQHQVYKCVGLVVRVCV